jgi:hypothetical protein
VWNAEFEKIDGEMARNGDKERFNLRFQIANFKLKMGLPSAGRECGMWNRKKKDGL